MFFGAEFAGSFTYIHYIEKVLEVPYRFDMSFTGDITDGEGRTFRHTHAIHTQCGGVKLIGKAANGSRTAETATGGCDDKKYSGIF